MDKLFKFITHAVLVAGIVLGTISWIAYAALWYMNGDVTAAGKLGGMSGDIVLSGMVLVMWCERWE